MQAGRGDLPGRCARSAMVSAVAHAGNATPCVPRRQSPASVTRCGCAARPRGDFRRPSAESDRGPASRCVVFLGVANAATSAPDQTDRDASVGPWPAEPAPTRLATVTKPCARTTTADGQLCETADSDTPERPPGGAGQAPGAADRDAPPMLSGSPLPPPTTPPTTSPFPDDVVGSDQNGFPMPQPCSGREACVSLPASQPVWTGPCATMACPTTPLTSACPGGGGADHLRCVGLLSHKRGFRKPAKRG